MKKKNGFTLVELLITITLMLTILVLAVVSFNKVSKNKKEESWNTVKLQVEAAARDYFTTNEYLFEGLSENATGSIAVGTLVKEDYLNKVIDPRNSKAIDTCAYVKVSKNGNALNATFMEGETKCENNSIVTVSEEGAPDLTLEYICKTPGNPVEKDASFNWCVHSDGGIIDVSSHKNGVTFEKTSTDSCEFNNNQVECKKSGKYNVQVTATKNGKTTRSSIKVYVDNDTPSAPTIKVTGTSGKNGWYKEKAVTMNSNSIKCNNISGCILQKSENENSNYEDVGKLFEKDKSLSSTLLYTIKDTASTTRYSKVCSGAGKCSNTASETVKVDTVAPIITGVSIKSKDNSYNSNLVYGAFNVKDELSGIDTVTSNVPRSDTGVKSWNKNGAKNWNVTSYPGKVSNSLDKTSISMKITATDLAGNTSSGSSGKYTVYNECDKTTTSTTYGSWSSCSKSCGGGTKYRNVTTTKKDKYTNKVCSTTTKKNGDSEACNTKSCTTTNVCSGFKSVTTSTIKNYISVSASVSKLNNSKKTIAKSGTSGTKATFTFKALKSGITIANDLSGAFCQYKDDCSSTSNHNSWNVEGSNTERIKNVWCDTTYSCKNNWSYVTSCAKVNCGSTTKTVCYRYNLTNSSGDFSSIK